MNEIVSPRYPDIHIQLHSHNPFALVSAIRLALRRSQVDDTEISRFTEEALAQREPSAIREVCSHWAAISVTP